MRLSVTSFMRRTPCPTSWENQDSYMIETSFRIQHENDIIYVIGFEGKTTWNICLKHNI